MDRLHSAVSADDAARLDPSHGHPNRGLAGLREVLRAHPGTPDEPTVAAAVGAARRWLRSAEAAGTADLARVPGGRDPTPGWMPSCPARRPRPRPWTSSTAAMPIQLGAGWFDGLRTVVVGRRSRVHPPAYRRARFGGTRLVPMVTTDLLEIDHAADRPRDARRDAPRDRPRDDRPDQLRAG